MVSSCRLWVGQPFVETTCGNGLFCLSGFNRITVIWNYLIPTGGNDMVSSIGLASFKGGVGKTMSIVGQATIRRKHLAVMLQCVQVVLIELPQSGIKEFRLAVTT